MGKFIELVKILKKRKINITSRDVDCKLWYSGGSWDRNEVRILVDWDLRDQVVDAYVPQVGLDKEVKKHFWEDLNEVVRNFNGHIGAISSCCGDVRGGCSFGDRNRSGTSLLGFAK
ncbi:hypothetical protein R3W88_027261 [Solanum pinnatisectum]|uniref:Uncharacterized protein n=1 Tax=Solanum pinnatisectum TaxID=50273 RepID=A0AAV9LJC2_9SOLN|nr:hypothetical protein R3W88_027261 [Solanum pinnatisectum]